MSMTLKALMDSLSEMAEHLPESAVVSINGETISDVRITMLNPIAEFGEAYGRIDKAIDPGRRKVVDISVNGREPPELPVARYPYQRIER
ncbi:hypothetical protein [Sphingopyxis sp. 550A]